MKIDLVTIFPGILDGPFKESMIKRAVEKKLVEINLVDLRTYTKDRHRQVDDTPYGGGCGMILKPEPFFEAVEDLKSKSGFDSSKVILMTPQGLSFKQVTAQKLSMEEHLIILCGRYEGVDERIRTTIVDMEISVGDYVLTGGELAAAVVVDAVVRLLPGFLAEEASDNESFSGSLLEHPHYTRPPVYRDMKVPEVLLSGNHAAIGRWRREESLKRTYQRRPDLIRHADLTPRDKVFLDTLRSIEDE